jgi:hypothetical protein
VRAAINAMVSGDYKLIKDAAEKVGLARKSPRLEHAACCRVSPISSRLRKYVKSIWAQIAHVKPSPSTGALHEMIGFGCG